VVNIFNNIQRLQNLSYTHNDNMAFVQAAYFSEVILYRSAQYDL